MLVLADKKAKAKGYEDIDFKQMTAENLRFEDASFDCVSISFGLRNVVNKGNAIVNSLEF